MTTPSDTPDDAPFYKCLIKKTWDVTKSIKWFLGGAIVFVIGNFALDPIIYGCSELIEWVSVVLSIIYSILIPVVFLLSEIVFNILITLGQYLISIPWYLYFLFGMPACIIGYSAWWCISRKFKREDYVGDSCIFIGGIISVCLVILFLCYPLKTPMTYPVAVDLITNTVYLFVISLIINPIIIYTCVTYWNYRRRLNGKSPLLTHANGYFFYPDNLWW